MDSESVIFAIVGLVMTGLGAAAMFSEKFSRHYMHTIPKGWLWRKMLGPDHATFAMHRIFGPLALVCGLVAIYFAISAMTHAP